RVGLAVKALRGWLAWESRANRQLLGREGVLALGENLGGEADSLAAADIRCETVSPGGADQLFPALAAAPVGGLFEPEGGAIRVRGPVGPLCAWTEDCLVEDEEAG